MKLRPKLILKFSIAGIIPFVLGIEVLLFSTRSIVQEQSKKIAVDYALIIASRIEAYFDHWKNVNEAVSNFPDVREKDWAVLYPIFKNVVNSHPEITDFVMTNRDGTYWYGSVQGNPYQNLMVTQDDNDPNSAKKNISSLSYHKVLVEENLSHEHKQFVTEPYIAFANGKKMLAICSSVLDYNGRVSGVIGCTIEAATLTAQYHSLLFDLTSYFSKSATLIITADDGKQLVAQYEWNDAVQEYTDRIDDSPVLVGIDKLSDDLQDAIENMHGSNSASDFFKVGNQNTFFVRSPISGTNYTVYLSVPEFQLFASDKIIISVMGIVGAVLFLVLGIVIFVVVRNDVVKPIKKTASALYRISKGDGDLTMRLDESRKDEIGELGGNFNHFVGNVHAIVSSIKAEALDLEEVATDLGGKVQDITNDIKDISGSVSNLNGQVEEQSAAAAETASTVEQISRNINHLTEQIDSQGAALSHSSASVHQMVSNVNSIAENLEKATKRFDELQSASTTGKTNINAVQKLVTDVSEQSAKLLDTNKLINSIANQTNLLAMNAAIEAAHAGEAGRGFSVVASEIRKLAEDASKQSKTIAEELKNVVLNIEEIVDATAKADTSFDIVVQQVGASSQIVEEISTSLKEQTVGNSQVLESLDHIQNTTEEVRDSSVEIGNGANSILKEVSHLKDIAQKVQQNSETISDAVSTIENAIDYIRKDSTQNINSVETLNELTAKFKL